MAISSISLTINQLINRKVPNVTSNRTLGTEETQIPLADSSLTSRRVPNVTKKQTLGMAISSISLTINQLTNRKVPNVTSNRTLGTASVQISLTINQLTNRRVPNVTPNRTLGTKTAIAQKTSQTSFPTKTKTPPTAPTTPQKTNDIPNCHTVWKKNGTAFVLFRAEYKINDQAWSRGKIYFSYAEARVIIIK